MKTSRDAPSSQALLITCSFKCDSVDGSRQNNFANKAALVSNSHFDSSTGRGRAYTYIDLWHEYVHPTSIRVSPFMCEPPLPTTYTQPPHIVFVFGPCTGTSAELEEQKEARARREASPWADRLEPHDDYTAASPSSLYHGDEAEIKLDGEKEGSSPGEGEAGYYETAQDSAFQFEPPRAPAHYGASRNSPSEDLHRAGSSNPWGAYAGPPSCLLHNGCYEQVFGLLSSCTTLALLAYPPLHAVPDQRDIHGHQLCLRTCLCMLCSVSSCVSGHQSIMGCTTARASMD